MLEATLRKLLRQWARQRDGERPSAELLQEVWSTLVGRDLAEQTAPVAWRAEKLVVAVPSEGWARELRKYPARFEGHLARLLPWEVPAVDFVVDEQRFYDETTGTGRGPARAAPMDGEAGGDEASPPEADPVDERQLPDDQREALEHLDESARGAALRILGHISETDTAD